MVQKIKFILLFIILFDSSFCIAGIEKISFTPNNSSVEFLAIGYPSALKIRGKNAKVQGQISHNNNAINAQFKVDLNDFDTGIEMRNEHMKEKYLETAKPENRYTTLEIINFIIPDSFFKGGEEYSSDFKGKLILHNITKEIQGRIKLPPYKKGSEVASFSTFTIKLTDYNISVPSFAGITVAENVNIEVLLPIVFEER